MITSLKTSGEIAQGTTSLLPSKLTFDSYKAVFTESNFLRPLANSAIIALSTTPLTVVNASLAGYALARVKLRGRGVILAFILLAGFFPVIAMVVRFSLRTRTWDCSTPTSR